MAYAREVYDGISEGITTLHNLITMHPKGTPTRASGQMESECQLDVLRLNVLKHLINHEIATRIADIKAAHNRSLPIHNLPAEIFIEILWAAIDPIPTWGIKQTLNLAGVSRYWRDTVDQSQRFWPLIDYYHPRSVNAHILNRCKSGPLAVRCDLDEEDWDPEDGGEEAFQLEDFLFEATLESRRARWRSVNFVWRTQGSWILPLLRVVTPVPWLKELFVHSYDDDESEEGFSVIPQPAEAPLHRLSLWAVGFTSWIPWPFSNLQALALDWTMHLAPSVQELHTMLSSSPRLGHLHLSHWQSNSTTDFRPRSAADRLRPVSLPHLQSVVIEDVPNDILQYLASMDIPTCFSVRVTAAQRAQVPDALKLCKLGIIQKTHFDMKYMPTTWNTGVRVTISSAELPKSAISWDDLDSHTPGFLLAVPLEGVVRAWEGLLAIVGGKGSHAVGSLTLGEFRSRFPLPVVATSGLIQYIDILNYEHAAEVLRQLSACKIGENGTTTCPFPNLLALNISGCRATNLQAEAMTLARTRCSNPVQMESEDEGKDVPLQKLRSVQLPDGPGWDAVKQVFERAGVEVLGPKDIFDIKLLAARFSLPTSV